MEKKIYERPAIEITKAVIEQMISESTTGEGIDMGGEGDPDVNIRGFVDSF